MSNGFVCIANKGIEQWKTTRDEVFLTDVKQTLLKPTYDPVHSFRLNIQI